VYGLPCANTIQGASESSQIRSTKNAGLTYLILSAISFKIVSLGTYTEIPSFFPCFKSTIEVIFLNAVEYRFAIPFGCQILLQKIIPSVSFSIGKTAKSWGAKSNK
jgi:hypothetical protein